MGVSQDFVPANYAIEQKQDTFETSQWELIGESDELSLQFAPASFEVIESGVNDDKAAEKKMWSPPDSEGAHGKSSVLVGSARANGSSGTSYSPEQIEAIRQEARAVGHSEASTELKANYDQQIRSISEGVSTVITDMQTQVMQNLQRVEKEAVQFSIEVARKIIHEAVEINPEYINGIVADALKMSGGASIKKVRVSPQDYEFINVVGISPDLTKSDEPLSFEADTTIRSGCVIETSAGEIDFDLDRAWERVRDRVFKAIS